MIKKILYELAEKHGFNIYEVNPGDGGFFYKGKRITYEEMIELLDDWRIDEDEIRSIAERKNQRNEK